MHLLRNLGEALAVRPNDEIWGIQGPYLTHSLPKMTIVDLIIN
jgi:hypothetical protein